MSSAERGAKCGTRRAEGAPNGRLFGSGTRSRQWSAGSLAFGSERKSCSRNTIVGGKRTVEEAEVLSGGFEESVEGNGTGGG